MPRALTTLAGNSTRPSSNGPLLQDAALKREAPVESLFSVWSTFSPGASCAVLTRLCLLKRAPWRCCRPGPDCRRSCRRRIPSLENQTCFFQTCALFSPCICSLFTIPQCDADGHAQLHVSSSPNPPKFFASSCSPRFLFFIFTMRHT